MLKIILGYIFRISVDEKDKPKLGMMLLAISASRKSSLKT